MIRVRPYDPTDRAFVISLAPRLALGIPPWRDPDAMRAAALRWILTSIDQQQNKTVVFIAENERGERLGFASVSHSKHYTGIGQAYLGELATAEQAEGQGAGTALIQACEQWAREQGYPILAVTTGAANGRALRLYHHVGYLDEDITLIKLVNSQQGG